MIDDRAFWLLTAGLGIGTYLIRFSFLGLLGGRTLPQWLLMHLKYVGAAVFPAMITPLVLWPEATGGQVDPARLIAAAGHCGAGLGPLGPDSVFRWASVTKHVFATCLLESEAFSLDMPLGEALPELSAAPAAGYRLFTY